MNDNNDKGLLPNPWPILMVVLLATGVLVDRQPLQSARPAAPESIEIVPVGEQDVAARLWQDPIAAVEKYGEHKGSATKQSSPGHTPDRVRETMRARGLDKVTVLAVSVFGGSYAAAAETRRRWRFAVVSALGNKGYLPERSDAIGYFRVDLPRTAGPSSLTVPYEWFRHDGDPPRYVLVIWLNEERITSKPNSYLQHIFDALDPYAAIQVPNSAYPALNAKLIGPSGSDMLANLIRERVGCLINGAHGEYDEPVFRYCNTFEVFSQGATVPTSDLFAKAGVSKRGPKNIGTAELGEFSIVRTTGADDELTAALLAELRRRGIKGDPKPKCADGLVLIREWDTQYSRRLSNYLTKNFADDCTREYTYLRGLDGALPDLNKQQNGPAPKNDKKELQDIPAGVVGGSPEHADGRSQYDYLRRIADQIKSLDTDREFAENGVKAIGIIGSDVYDKLLVLQALRPSFKDAVFFTTDLDARYLHADQNTWTRNLVVASNFGLVLRPELQCSTPPFRGAYQTATYLATLMALENQDLDFWSDKTSNWLRPQIFEIGRRQAVHLYPGPSAAKQDSGPRDCAPDWTNFARIEPAGKTGSPWFTTVALLALAALIGFLLLALTSSRLQAWIRSFYNDVVSRDRATQRRASIILWVAGAAAFGVLLAIGWAWYAYEQSLVYGVGEPFLWLEGISVWPSLVLRFAGVLAAIVIATVFMFRTHRQAKEISEHFFGLEPPAPRNLERPWWRAAFIGPHLDLTRFGPDGKEASKASGAAVELSTLWRNYLRATGWREMGWWIALAVLLNVVLGFIAFRTLERPFFPGRGTLVLSLHYISLIMMVPTLWATIFWVGYETRACASFISKLCEQGETSCEKDSGWLKQCGEAAKMNVPNDCRAAYFIFQLIVVALRRIQGLIYLPFILILFMVVARADFLDAMNFPLPLVLVTVLALGYALVTTVLLRRSAEAARTRILEHFEGMLLKPEVPEGSPPPKTEQIKLVMKRIRATKEGVFAPFSRQPALQALLLPFGGYGSVQIIQYLLTIPNV